MNKKTTSILCLTALYSIFFYHQHAGINFLIFTIAAIAFFYFQDKTILKSKAVLLVSFAAVFAASFLVVNDSTLSGWATVVALLVLPGVIINRRSSVIIDLFSSLFTTTVAAAYMVVEMVESGKNGKGKGFLHLLKYIVPIVFVIAFFFIYRAMNPLFEKFTQEIAEFISLEWVFFTLGGFLLVYSFYKQRRINDLDNWEKNGVIVIDEATVKTPKWNESVAFLLLFVVLNAMLVVVNSMDVNYLYLGQGMPDGITHKEFVHKGVGMLILSIILGISILLFFFRGALNFSKNKTFIKALAFLWVLQNVFMVCSTAIRNTMYIDAALLTYKRIGVYFWLFFAIIGLITLFIKLQQNKTVWFLFRYNFASLFVVLILSSAFDWDRIISTFNINRAKQMVEISSLDKNYLLDISEGNIKALYEIKNLAGFEVDSVYSYDYYRNDFSFDRNNYDNNLSNSSALDCKVFDFLKSDAQGDWRSYSVRRNQVRKDIQQLHANGMLNSLELQGHYIASLEPIYGLTNITELNLNNDNFSTATQLAGINELPQLKKLYLNSNYIYKLDTLKPNTNLTHLTLQQNELNNVKFLKNFANIDSLELSNNKLITLSSLPTLKHLKTLHLDGNPLNDISKLTALPNLKELSLNNIVGNVGKFPYLKTVEKLSVNSSQSIVVYGISNATSFPALTYLDVSNNVLYDLSALLNKENKSKTPLLQSLNISSNSISTFYGVEAFDQLTFLDASYNKLYNVTGLEKLTLLQQLNLCNNDIRNLQFLTNLIQLQELNISNNANIIDFKELAKLTQLNSLILSATSIRDLQPINTCTSLQLLNLSGCRIKGWDVLASFPQIENLSVSYLTSKDLASFKALPNLKYLTITNTEESVVALFKKELPNVEIY